MNEVQALSWARLADVLGRRSLNPLDLEDAVQSAVARAMEKDDLVDRLMEVRMAIRYPTQISARNEERQEMAAQELVEGPEGNEPHQDWLDMFEEQESALDRRLREVYAGGVKERYFQRQEDGSLVECIRLVDGEVVPLATAEDAIEAQESTPYGCVVAEHEEMLRELEEAYADRQAVPYHMQPEFRMDHGEVDLALEAFRFPEPEATWYWQDWVYRKPVDDVVEWLGWLGGEAVRFAHLQAGLSPVEAAHFVNQLAQVIVDEAPYKRRGRYYNAFRNGAGDWMALCDPEEQDYLPGYKHHRGKGIIPGNMEVTDGAPGACSNYSLEDEDVWMWLFPDGPGNEVFTLPRGSVRDMVDLVNYIDGLPPENVDWEHWDSQISRQAFAIKALGLSLDEDGNPVQVAPSSWKVAAKAGRDAFWQLLDGAARSELLSRNGKALYRAGLRRDPEDGYKIKSRHPDPPEWADEHPVLLPAATESDSVYWG